MLVRKLSIVFLVLGVAGIASMAFAQDGADQDKTLLNRLDDFGKSIFGGRSASEKTKAKESDQPKTESRLPRKPTAVMKPDDLDTRGTSTTRAGSILAGAGGQRTSIGDGSAGNESAYTPESPLFAVPRAADGTPGAVRRPLSSKSLLNDDDMPRITSQPLPIVQPKKVSGVSIGLSDDLPEISAPRKPAARPLYERLSAVRQSVFGDDDPRPQPKLPPARTADAPLARAPVSPELDMPKAAGRPIVVQRTKPAAIAEAAITAEPSLAPAANSPTSTWEKTPAANKPEPDSQGGVLFARKGPFLSVETVGPRRITVGKESSYEVRLVNSGEVAAEELVVFVSLPESAEVAGTEASAGVIQASAVGQPAGMVLWKLNHLDAAGRERLLLRIVPRQNHPFDLAVRWESKPAASQAVIEVQEPKLLLQLEGPHEVLYGKKEMYRLKLTNTGNGNAENVAIMLKTVGTGENVPATHKIGTLAAGGEKVLDVELTARQAGNLAIQVEAQADGARAELSEKVLVRRAGLEVDVEGPKVQFIGTVATYVVRVRNPGTAPARNVNLSVTLPPGAKYLAGIENVRHDAAANKLEWTVESIGPAMEQSTALKCSLATSGVNHVQVKVTADDDLSASVGTVTQVEAVANLVMIVKNPEGPVSVGEEATYELRVRNRGTKEAEDVEVFAYLSNGIEPTAAEGGPNRLGPGQVVFSPIKSLAPGAEAVLKVRARAEVGGNHIFRAETHCKPLGARLVSEVTNLYYLDASAGPPMTGGLAGQGAAAPAAMRTVNRPLQGEQSIAPPRKE